MSPTDPTAEQCCNAHVEPEPVWYDGYCCENCPQLIEARHRQEKPQGPPPLDPSVLIDPSASAADIATQLRAAGADVVVLDVPAWTQEYYPSETWSFLAETMRLSDDVQVRQLADQIEAQTRLPEPPPVSNERAARLIRHVCRWTTDGRDELLRFADQLEADR